MASKAQEEKTSQETPAVSENTQMEQGVRDMKAVLDAQPKVRVKLYQVPKNSTDAELPPQVVQINGYIVHVPRGIYVDVPQGVADILTEAGY